MFVDNALLLYHIALYLIICNNYYIMLMCRNTHTQCNKFTERHKNKITIQIINEGLQTYSSEICDSVGHFISGALHRMRRCCTAVLQRGNGRGRCSESAGTAMNGE